MAEHQFLVTVSVDGFEDPGDGRTEEDYAKATLYAAGLRDAEHLDGFCDLQATAYLDSAQPA